MTNVLLIHHAASGDHGRPANSLAAVAACVAAEAQAIEVDVQALAGGDFALLHDPLLDGATTGHGPVDGHTAAEVRELRLLPGTLASAEPVALLSQVVALLRDRPHPAELQLDLKVRNGGSPSAAALGDLTHLVEPLAGRVRVSSEADWTLRRLHALAPWMALGFDPLLYLDLPSPEPEAPPFRLGAYGYCDDHPLATAVWGEPRDYLAERAEALSAQAPWAAVWYIRAAVLAHTLDDGFDWLSFLHCRGAQVAAWTLDAGRPGDPALARRLIAVGVDRLTTNNPRALADALRGPHNDVAFRF